MSGHMKIFKALADETRLQVVRFLAQKKECSCGEVSTRFPKLTQPTLSHHFKILAEAKIITVRKEGTARVYALNRQALFVAGVDARKL